jgi:hypothetical protein
MEIDVEKAVSDKTITSVLNEGRFKPNETFTRTRCKDI